MSLRRKHFQPSQGLQDGLTAMMHKASSSMLSLGIEQFGHLFDLWGGDIQCDAVEFAAYLLTKLDQDLV